MVIGVHQPKRATNTTFKSAIAIGLDEAMTALEECFFDLTDEQMQKFILPDRHNISTLVMHCLFNFDLHCCEIQTGKLACTHPKQADIWHHPPEVVRREMATFPTRDELLKKLACLRPAAFAILEATPEAELTGPTSAAPEWYRASNRTKADTYMRTICHAMTHIRQIWQMRGLMGLTDKNGWAQQHWA